MTSEQILEQLFDKNYVETEVEIVPNKIKIKIKSLSGADQLNIEESMYEVKGSTAYVLHIYSLRILSKVLISYNDTKFESTEEAYKFISELPAVVIERIVKEHIDLEKLVKDSVNKDTIEKAFFQEAQSPKEPEQ